jgi:Single-stranded DNA-binding protein
MDFASPVFVWLVPFHSTKTGSALQVKSACLHLLCFGQKSAQGRWTRSAQREGVNIMGTSINIQVTGFVGSDPQVKTVGEQQVASFSVAVNRKNGSGKKQTLWVRVNCWNKLADVAAQYVKKGSLVQVTTEWLRPSAWIDQSGAPQASLDVDANRLVLLDRLESDEPENGEDIPF